MALVDYASSESGNEDEEEQASLSNKRQKLDNPGNVVRPSNSLPPLPSTFQDLYSSTVRTSTQDDPTLHGGRKRVTPHVEGNWPTHVYLDWRPSHNETSVLSRLVKSVESSPDERTKDGEIHSLLHNHLGVPLPMHISLSRPLVLSTEQRDDFVGKLKKAINRSNVSAFTAGTGNLAWHPNEGSTRWFLVLGISSADNNDMSKLLSACNTVAEDYGQPQLYFNWKESSSTTTEEVDSEQHAECVVDVQSESRFHVSLAWSLSPQLSVELLKGSLPEQHEKALQLSFNEVKIRVGQDVHTVMLPRRRE